MNEFKTAVDRFTIRFATEDDAALAVEFTKKLGVYQKMLERTTVTEEDMYALLSTKKGEALFGLYDGQPCAFLYFYSSSSAFMGASGIYIDVFYVDADRRSLGLGKAMFSFISKLALERGCKRLEWVCLDWNEPSIQFYKDRGADRMDTMHVYRMRPEALEKVAQT